MQNSLNSQQLSAFHHDHFVAQQCEHFATLVLADLPRDGDVVDVGGGCGLFSRAVSCEFGVRTRLIDSDADSVQMAIDIGVNAVVGDALNPNILPNDKVVCFNLILHHLVGKSDQITLGMQSTALKKWKRPGIMIFVNEYIYESMFDGFSGWFIYFITKSPTLSMIGRFVSFFIPSLRANTFGVGVRFRSSEEWRNIFCESGFSVVREARGIPEPVSLARRLLLIKEIRRDSYLLRCS